ncbi:MAG: site-2 protease family protein [Rhodothermia bacterium]|nr:site-2 protease family protein [Rhodothermia bacterium]
MTRSLRIGKIAGIDLKVHWTFSLLIFGVFGYYLLSGNTVSESLFGLGLILSVFVCVVLHEFGHALTARHYAVATRDITLYPIGGVARLQQIPEEPRKEFWISVAGPAVNVVIAGILFLGITFLGSFPTIVEMMEPAGHFAAKLMWFNIVLVGFNMLPAFPMDGGRVLRAILAMRTDYMKATQVAAAIGQGMAILFGFLGIVTFNPILLFIALFVYVGAQQEARMTMIRIAVEGVPVRQAMVTRFETLRSSSTVSDAVEKLLAGSQQEFPVVDEGQLAGLLTRKTLVQALSENDLDTRVSKIMQQSCAVVQETEMLEDVFRQMQEEKCSALPVMSGDTLVGILTLENVGELMMINSAMTTSKARGELEDLITS